LEGVTGFKKGIFNRSWFQGKEGWDILLSLIQKWEEGGWGGENTLLIASSESLRGRRREKTNPVINLK